MQVSGQRPGETSGAYNRSLCRSTPVLSYYPGAGLPRIPVGRFFAVLLVPGAGWPCSYLPPGGCRIGLRHLIEAPRRGMTGCASPPSGWKTSTAPWRSALCPDLGAAASCGVMPQGLPVSPVRDRIRRSRSCTCRGLVMDLSCTCRVPAAVTRLITRLRCPLVAAVSQMSGRLTQIWLWNQGRSDVSTIGTAADWMMRFLVHPNPPLRLAAQGCGVPKLSCALTCRVWTGWI